MCQLVGSYRHLGLGPLALGHCLFVAGLGRYYFVMQFGYWSWCSLGLGLLGARWRSRVYFTRGTARSFSSFRGLKQQGEKEFNLITHLWQFAALQLLLVYT